MQKSISPKRKWDPTTGTAIIGDIALVVSVVAVIILVMVTLLD